ncbi:MAG: hypothetical protein ACTTK1_07455 [Candidatus Cryptobacteroides sp.]
MRRILFAIVTFGILCCGNVVASDSASFVNGTSTIESYQSNQTFNIVGYYTQNGQYYKCKLKLKLVQSMYGQNDYMCIGYAMDYFNGKWIWKQCSISCRYDAVKRQNYLSIGMTTVYFDDPMD